jgi:hypothetical protein
MKRCEVPNPPPIIPCIFLTLLIGLLSIVVISAATLQQPTVSIEEYLLQREDLQVPTHTIEKDKAYLQAIQQQQVIFDYYSGIVGCENIVYLVLHAAREYGVVDIDILFALMWKESMFLPTAVNRNATSIDRGLFQLNSNVYYAYPAEQFFDIEWNIRTGVRHYAIELQVAHGDHRIALHAYNAGRSRRYSPPPTTRAYATEILNRASKYQEERELLIAFRPIQKLVTVIH